MMQRQNQERTESAAGTTLSLMWLVWHRYSLYFINNNTTVLLIICFQF